MKIIISAFFILVFGTNMSAQKHVVKVSDEIPLAYNVEFSEMLHSDESGAYLLFGSYSGSMFSNKYTPIIKKFDKNFKEVYSKEFKSSINKVTNIGMKYMNGKIAWFFYENDTKANIINVYNCSIDLNGNSSKPEKFVSFGYKSKKDIPAFDFKINRDTTGIVLISELDIDKKNNKYKSYVCVFDKNLNKVWDKKLNMNYSQKRIDTYSWGLTNNMEVFFVGLVFDNDKLKSSKKSKDGSKMKIPAYKLTLFKVLDGQDDFTSIDINLNKSFNRGILVEGDHDSNLIIAGVFGDYGSEDGKGYGTIIGSYFVKVNGKSNAVEFLNKRKFSSKEIKSFGKKYTDKHRKSSTIGLENYFRMKNIVILDDGSFNFFIEQNYRRVVSNKYSTTTFFHSNLIVVTSVSSVGEIEHVSVIPKRQKFTSFDMYTSYSFMNTKDNVYFLYNDSYSNLKKNKLVPDKYKKLTSPKKCVAVLAHFENGKLIRKPLFDRKDTNTSLLAQSSKQISNNEFMFFSSKMKILGKTKFKFGTINVN